MTRIEQAAAAVDAARAMLADLEALPRASHAEVVELLARTAELSRIVDAQRVRLAAEIVERSKGEACEALCRRLGHRSAKEALASAFGLRARDAQAMLALAAATTPSTGLSGSDIPTRYPRVASALDRAEISLAQAQAIVEHLEPAAPRADLDELAWAESALVDAATDPDAPLVPELLVTQARAYVAVLDPDGVLPNAERQRAMRSLRMRALPDGSWHLRMTCPPEAGSAIKALLDAYTSPRVRVAFRDTCGTACGTDRGDGCDCGREVDPDGRSSADGIDVVDDRTPEQKRHDVLVALAQAHAASGDEPVAGGEPPTLVLKGTIEAYDAYLRGAEHADRTLTIEHTGSLVPIETIGRLACDAIIRHAIVDAQGHPLSLGSTERLFTRAQRRALAVRDKGCRVPGCGMPVAWCEAHHVVPWQLGGPTDVDNGILVCNYHHHEIHAGRIIVESAGPTRGAWRVVPELRPADRYARVGRIARTRSPEHRGDLARIPAASVGVGGAARGGTGAAATIAADASPSLAVRIPARSLPHEIARPVLRFDATAQAQGAERELRAGRRGAAQGRRAERGRRSRQGIAHPACTDSTCDPDRPSCCGPEARHGPY